MQIQEPKRRSMVKNSDQLEGFIGLNSREETTFGTIFAELKYKERG